MKISVNSPSFSKNNILKNEINRYFKNIKFNIEGKRFNKNELINFIKDSDGIIVGLETIDKEILDNCPNLKIISKYGVGLNNIDLKECEKRGIKIGWTGGINRLSVAEMTLGYMLMLCRNLYRTSNQLKNGVWNKSGGFQLTGKTIGIIGIGYIGKELIRLLRPFNCKILVNDIINQSDYYKENNLIESSKDDIYKYSDIVTIHIPLDQLTKNIIDSSVFNLMKKESFIINSARGGIINENDLKVALKEKKIAGAAIDAYLIEPPLDNELLSFDNLICTPHIGGNSKEAIEAMGLSAIKHLKEYFIND